MYVSSNGLYALIIVNMLYFNQTYIYVRRDVYI